MTALADVIPGGTTRVLDHGFVRLDDAMASDLSVVNGARVSFARRREELDEADAGLIRFLMRDRHGTPFEHNAFRFHVRAPIFVAREWFRHRVGCLTGDTEISFVDINGSTARQRRKTIDDLWRMWSRGERDGHALTHEQRAVVRTRAAGGESQRSIARALGVGRRAVRSCLAGSDGLRDARWRVRKLRVRVLDESRGEFTFGHISDVIDKGVQPVYQLTLADGKQLTLTENHRLLTSDGWRTMRQAVGLAGEGGDASMTRACRVMVNGVPVHQDARWLRERRERGLGVAEIASEAGCSYHTVRKWLARHDMQYQPYERCGCSPWNKGRRGYTTRLVVSCHRAVHRSRNTELTALRRFAASAEVDLPEELPPRRGFRLTAHAVEVVAVTYVGLRRTYDLSIEGPWHNFVANGMVVHNSFNEFSMRYAKATDDFYVPEPEDVRSQVGKPGAYSFEPVEPELAQRTRGELREVYEHAYGVYERLVELGVARELARCVMPVGAYTEFYWTVNARALMNFVSLRAAESAQREIRRYAEAVEGFFAEAMPVTHAAFVAAGRVAP